MEIGYTMLERAILGLSGAAYCTGYSYAAWYFLKRNHRADEIPGMFRALTVLLLFLSSVLSLWQEHALLYAGTGMVILIILSVGAYQRSRTGIVETLLFAMAVFGSYLIFTLLLQLLWFGFGSAVAMKVGEWYFLWRSAIYLILAAEYILISRYFVKVFRGKDQVLLTKGQTMIFLVFPFLMLGLLVVAGSVAAGDLYIALMCGGLWSLAYRLLLIRYYVSKYNIPAVPKDRIVSLSSALKEGGTSLTMFLGIIVPLVVITGPVGNFLKTLPAFGEDGVDAMNIIIWVPVLIMFICIIEGRKLLPKTASGWGKLLSSTAKTCCSCGAVSLFAMAGSNALTATGFGDDLTALLSAMDMPKFLMILIIGFIVALVAGPLNATSTTVSLGPVAYSAMVAVGVPPVTAIVSFLIFASTEGASPPMSSPIFVSSSIAGVEDVSVMFKALIFHYVVPIVLVGSLIAMGILPIIGG